MGGTVNQSSPRHLKQRARVVAIASAALLAVLIAACTDDAPSVDEALEDDPDAEEPVDEPDDDPDEPEEAAEEEQELEPASIRVAFGPSGGLMGPYVYGAAEGIYAAHGIDLEVEDGAGSLVTAQDVAAGNSDFAMMGASAMAQGIDEGMPLVSVGGIWARPQFGILVPEDETDIQSFEDMEGRSVIVSPGSPETVMMPAAFEALGVDQSEVEVISVDAPAKGSSFVQGLGDTVGTSFPYFRAVFAAQGVDTDVLLFEDAGVGFPEFHVVTTLDTLEERPDMIERFLRATYEALEQGYDDPDGVADALLAARPAVEEEIDAARESFVDHFEFTCTEAMDGEPFGYHVESDWRTGLEVLQEFGDLTGDIEDLSRYFTNQFHEGDDPVTDLTCPWPS